MTTGCSTTPGDYAPERDKAAIRTCAVRSRFVRQKAAGMRLEQRDEVLLCDLFLQRALSRSQIEELHFTSTARCNARLRLLFDHRFVERYFPPASPFGAQAVYTAGRAAVPVLSRRLEMDMTEVARLYRRGKTPTFIEHTLAIADVWLAFRRAAAKTPDIDIERWLPEMQCRHEWEIRATGGGKWKKETFKPDGFIRLQAGNFEHCFFIEADLGHTSSGQFANKLATHIRYLESGLFEQTYGAHSFQTLVITTGTRRLQNLKALAQKQGSRLFLFSCWEGVLSQSAILGPIWSAPFESRQIPIVSSAGR